MAKKALPKIIIKSMWEHINSGASEDSMRDWLIAEGNDEQAATELVAKLTSCESEEALFNLVNAGREPEAAEGAELSDDELETVAGGARAAAGSSKWPWQSYTAEKTRL